MPEPWFVRSLDNDGDPATNGIDVSQAQVPDASRSDVEGALAGDAQSFQAMLNGELIGDITENNDSEGQRTQLVARDEAETALEEARTQREESLPNAIPSAADDSASVDAGDSVTIDVLANDSDPEGNLDAASVTVISAPANGTTSVDTSTGAITFTPDTGFQGMDSFAYTVDDADGATSNAATVFVTVNAPDAANTAPSASDDSASVTLDVLANDNDPDGSLDPSAVTVISAPANGTTSVDTSNGAITYTPEAGFSDADSLAYTVDDDDGATSNVATVDVTVNAVNDAPIVLDDSASVVEDNSVTLDVLANDGDLDGSLDASSVTVISDPANGSTSVDTRMGAITYTPDPDFTGAESFAYSVDDDAGVTSNPATVDVTVDPVLDFTDAAVAPGDQPKEVTFTWTDDGDPVDAFRLEVNPDGVSGFTGADVDGDGSVDADDLIAGDASEVSVALPVHRTDFDNARYQVVALDSDGNELDRSASVGLLNNVTAEDIIGYFKASNTDGDDEFGTSVALADDGDTLAVGAKGEDSNADDIGGDQNNDDARDAGALYLY